jgi:hypothetical protein
MTARRFTVPGVTIDSESVGEQERFHSLAELEQRLDGLPEAPADMGCVMLIVRRVTGGRRETPGSVQLGIDTGVPGDKWGGKPARKADMQLAVMQHDVAELIANGQPLLLFGDNLFLDLDLSKANLPTGSRVRLGSVLLEVTAEPHDGCTKFRSRFGGDALRFVSMPALRHRNLRGIYMRVLEAGEVGVGDAAEVVARP